MDLALEARQAVLQAARENETLKAGRSKDYLLKILGRIVISMQLREKDRGFSVDVCLKAWYHGVPFMILPDSKLAEERTH